MPIVPRVTRAQPNENLESFLLADSSDVASIRDIIESAPDPQSAEAQYQVTFQPGDYSGVSGVEVPSWVNVVVLPGADFSSGAFTGATDNVVDLNRLAQGALDIGDNLTIPGKLTVRNSTASGPASVFETDLIVGRDLTVQNDIVAKTVTELSSITLKDNVTDMEPVLDRVMRLDPVRFTWKDSGEPDFGLVAEEVAEVFPEAVTTDDNDDAVGVQYAKLTAILVRAIQGIVEELQTI